VCAYWTNKQQNFQWKSNILSKWFPQVPHDKRNEAETMKLKADFKWISRETHAHIEAMCLARNPLAFQVFPDPISEVRLKSVHICSESESASGNARKASGFRARHMASMWAWVSREIRLKSAPHFVVPLHSACHVSSGCQADHKRNEADWCGLKRNKSETDVQVLLIRFNVKKMTRNNSASQADWRDTKRNTPPSTVQASIWQCLLCWSR